MTELVLAVAVLILGAGGCLLPLANTRRVAIGLLSQLVATVLVLRSAVPVLLGGEPVVGLLAWAYPMGNLRVRLDALGAFFLSWSMPLCLLGSVYAVGYLKPYFTSRRHLGVHFALLNMTALAFILVYSGDQALVFLMGWETAALAAWLLVIWDYTNQKIRFAGFNYLVSTHIGLIFLVAAFMVMYAHAGSWELERLGIWLRSQAGGERDLVFLLLLISFGLKSAFFPFHSWLPRAHAAAPAHVSALMSGVIHKAGLYALLRFLWLMGRPDEWMGWCLIVFSATSAVVGALYSVGQRDLKRLLGYSSTENVGIAGIGFGVGCLGLSWDNPALVLVGFAGGLLHVLNHAFFKCLLFYGAGAVYQGAHTVNLERLGGLARQMPWTTACFAIGAVAISALPPLNGFASEFLIYAGLFSSAVMPGGAQLALCLVAVVLAFVGAVSALSMTRAFGIAFLGAPRDASLPTAHEANRWMLLPLVFHALGVVLLGLFPLLGFWWVQGATRVALANTSAAPLALAGLQAGMVETVAWVGALSGGVLLLVLALQWLRSRWGRAAPAMLHRTWGCGYGLPNARMQYTGASFSADFSARFRSVLTLLQRKKAPTGYFPNDAYLITDCVDSVERRIYTVIGQGENSAQDWSDKLREDDPRLAFGLGLVALLVIAGLAVLAGGAMR